MSEWYWMDWNTVPEDRQKSLYAKVGGSTTMVARQRVQIRQVYNDPRIPIIRRYQNHWATEEIAKTVASGRRKRAYLRGDVKPPKRFAHNAANSAKRNPAAPRGRWDSVSQSVKPKGKCTDAGHADHETAQDISAAPPEPLDQGSINATDAHATDTRSLMYITPGSSGLQDGSSSQIDLHRHSSCSSLQPGLTHTRGDLADPSGMRGFVAGSCY